MKLRTILLILTISASLCVAAVGYSYYRSLNRSLLLECEENTVRDAEKAHARFSAFLSENMRSIKVLAGSPALAAAAKMMTSENRAAVNAILDRFATAIKAEACYLIDGKGIVIASSNRHQLDSFVGNDLGFRPYFQNALRGNPDIYMAVGTTAGRRGVYYSHPVYHPSEPRPMAVAVIKSSPDIIELEWQTQAQDKKSITLVVDANGMIFVSSHSPWLLHLMWPLDSDQTRALAQSGQFGRGPWEITQLERTDDNRALGQDGTDYLMYAIDLHNYPGWRIVQLLNIRSAYQHFSGPLLKLAGWGTALVCLLFGSLLIGLFFKANAEIHRRRRAEEDLRNKHEILDLVLSVSPIGICLLENRRIQWANNAFIKLFGLKSRKDCDNHSIQKLYSSKEEYDRVGKALYTRNNHRLPAEVDAQFKRIDGSLFTGNVSVRHTSGKHTPKQVICTISDISARVKAEEERVLKEKLQGVLETAGAVCHEQNQPLMAITGYCTLALMEMDPADPGFDRINSIYKSAERMAATTAKLMNITKYHTCEYADGTQIIDIDKSAASPTD